MNSNLREQFEYDGFIVVKDIFSIDEISDIRDNLRSFAEEMTNTPVQIENKDFPASRFFHADLCAVDGLKDYNYIVFNPKIINIIKKIIGEDVVYFGESNVHIGEGLRGFHRDSRYSDRRNPNGPDYRSDYNLVRVAIYLHDCDLFSGGVKIVPGSHDGRNGSGLAGQNVDSVKGDIVIWKLTTLHSGNAKRVKGCNKLSLLPRLEEKLPKIIESKNPLERMAMFAVFGAPGEHLERYLDYFQRREDCMQSIRYCGVGDNLHILAEASGVKWLKPVEFYGANSSMVETHK